MDIIFRKVYSQDNKDTLPSDILLLLREYNMNPVIFDTTNFIIKKECPEIFDRGLRISGLVKSLLRSKKTTAKFIGRYEIFNGGRDLEYFDHCYLDFTKMYEFLTNPVSSYYIPMRIEDNGMIIVHPGTTKFPLLTVYNHEVSVKLLMFDNTTSRNNILISKLKQSMPYRYISECTDDEIYKLFGIDQIKSSYMDIKICRAKEGYNTIEVTEDHRAMPAFTADKNYVVEITEKEIFVNDVRMCILNDDLWEIDTTIL